MKDKRFDLEGELRAGRSQPRDEFAKALAGEVRGASSRARQSRFGVWLAVAGLVIVSVASFGGISYAATDDNAASAQYNLPNAVIATAPKAKPFSPPKAIVKKKAVQAKNHPVKITAETKAATVAPKANSGQLPFTGLALWIPLAFGLVLIASGLTLRTRARRRGSEAH